MCKNGSILGCLSHVPVKSVMPQRINSALQNHNSLLIGLNLPVLIMFAGSHSFSTIPFFYILSSFSFPPFNITRRIYVANPLVVEVGIPVNGLAILQSQ